MKTRPLYIIYYRPRKSYIDLVSFSHKDIFFGELLISSQVRGFSGWLRFVGREGGSMKTKKEGSHSQVNRVKRGLLFSMAMDHGRKKKQSGNLHLQEDVLLWSTL